MTFDVFGLTHKYVMSKSEPLQTLENVILILFFGTFLVGVFNTQYKSSLMFTREKIRKDSGAISTGMKKSGRTWGKSSDNFFLCFVIHVWKRLRVRVVRSSVPRRSW